MEGIPAFRQRLYAALRCIPAGRTISYGDLAVRIGDGCTARDVGGQWARTRSQSSFRATGLWRPMVRWAGSLLGAASRRNCVMLNIERALTSNLPTLFGSLPLGLLPKRRPASAQT
jgi:methylated-DNA-[protein]-cysteine S-methyltransferase